MANDDYAHPKTPIETKWVVEHLERSVSAADRGGCEQERVVA